MTDPHGFSVIRQAAGHIENVFICLSGQLPVCAIIDMLNIQHKQIRNLHELFKPGVKGPLPGKRIARSIQAGMNAFSLRKPKQFCYEINLQQGFAAANSDSTVISPIRLIAEGLF